MDAEPGSRAARRQAAQHEHPVRYASLHVLEGVGAVLLTVLRVGAIIQCLLHPLLGRMPSVDLPSLPLADLPDIPWPDIPWPAMPSFELPGRLQALLGSMSCWLPIALGAGTMGYEMRRQKRHPEARDPDSRNPQR